ncbi:hypothetical protein [Halostella litorea]|uniref:hypothetical protein n=1 Tax=Halostella litorea TaxID=2528831 RepID=UPI001092C7F7|nr:hypothetical protein [Halostella litorea]
MADVSHEGDLHDTLEKLTRLQEFEVDLSESDAVIASDRVAVDTPVRWLEFEVQANEDHGTEHDRHDPSENVYVNMWLIDRYTIVHTQDGTGEDASHRIDVHKTQAEERAIELVAHGIPERRAEIAALREQGLTYSEIVKATGKNGPNHRGGVSNHLQRYNEQVKQARWLAANAPPLDLGKPYDESDSNSD